MEFSISFVVCEYYVSIYIYIYKAEELSVCLTV